VCNHPDLFEGRPIVSAFDSPPLVVGVPSRVMVGCTSPPLDQELGWLVNQVRQAGREGRREGGNDWGVAMKEHHMPLVLADHWPCW
jgi:hypothetical protein